MPASQLKRLKASLREQGITGPQKSKKQKKAQNGRDAKERVQRDVALHQIRESFNPFEYKANARPEKFTSVSSKSNGAHGASGRYKEVLHRPGVTKSAGEEMRRNTLLPELQRRNKVGGLVDRRIGEGDVDMTPEERAVQRFTQEKERKRKGAGLFDLEASDEERGIRSKLTHGGRSLDDLEADDFDDEVSEESDLDEDGDLLRRKRRRADEMNNENPLQDEGRVEDQLERKKTKKEVMEEVIAKSKFHKYERQKAKEDDDELREELDQGFGDMLSLLRGLKQPMKSQAQPDLPKVDSNGPTVNPERQKLLDGTDRDQLDRDYDVRLRQLARDTRAKPSERTKTDEEKAAAEAERLKDLEEKRTKRMRGEDVSEDEGEPTNGAPDGNEDEEIPNQAAEFGFESTAGPKAEKQIVLDDEDEFLLDEDLVASGSDVDLSEVESQDDSDGESSSELAEVADHEDEEDEFVRDILGDDVMHLSTGKSTPAEKGSGAQPGLAYTYPCPRSHDELLATVKDVPLEQFITVIKRIRALYHPSLSDLNKESMADFACALVDHLSYMGSEKQPLAVTEQVIRHLHSLSRTYPLRIGEAFRKQLASLHERGQPHAGDLVILTAIGSIYPTSDHWHQVVTPAITIMARWLGLNAPNLAKSVDSKTLTLGGFLVALCIQYQKLSRRFIPEALRFTSRALSIPGSDSTGLSVHVNNLTAMAEMWKDHSAFTQSFSPAVPILKQLKSKKALQRLQILLQQSHLRLRPLELHHHRPLAIRTTVPKFEDGFHPDKHYDPDKERSEAKKLQKEYKRERKGAVRELRKDANFIAREQLREKKARDAEYEAKYRRLVTEVQAEEGYEANNYEREKRARIRKRAGGR